MLLSKKVAWHWMQEIRRSLEGRATGVEIHSLFISSYIISEELTPLKGNLSGEKRLKRREPRYAQGLNREIRRRGGGCLMRHIKEIDMDNYKRTWKCLPSLFFVFCFFCLWLRLNLNLRENADALSHQQRIHRFMGFFNHWLNFMSQMNRLWISSYLIMGALLLTLYDGGPRMQVPWTS